MKLRPRQVEFVDKSISALKKHNNTLAVGPTGFGKTIALSGVVARIHKERPGKVLVLQHRDELVGQNSKKFLTVNPGANISLFTAERRSWLGNTVFAMVQTLSRENRLATMPPLAAIVVDETHHIVAESYQRIVNHAREMNPDLWLYGVTATTARTDGKRYDGIFNNVADQVTIAELIASGHLVPPRTFVLDAAGTTADLQNVDMRGAEYDMEQVNEILNKRVVHNEVIRHWKEKAGSRCTIVFCSNIEHAEDTTAAFVDAGVNAVVLHGKLSKKARRDIVESFERGEIQVLVNVNVLTEGFDHQPVSCIILLRPSSAKGPFIQMIGRGLRIVDLKLFPGLIKTDCIVLDFGTASMTHGTLEETVRLTEKAREYADESDMVFQCPNCLGEIPSVSEECPLCGYQIEVEKAAMQEEFGLEAEELDNVTMREINLLQKSNYSYIDMFDDDHSLMVNGFTAWAGLFQHEGIWYALGAIPRQRGVTMLRAGERYAAMAAADDFMNIYEDEPAARKNKRWKTEPATKKQLKMLGRSPLDMTLTKDKAAALITFGFNKRAIQGLIFSATTGITTGIM